VALVEKIKVSWEERDRNADVMITSYYTNSTRKNPFSSLASRLSPVSIGGCDGFG
jgi:hypothetical protein